MKIHKNIVYGEFINRPNRFQAYIKLNNEIIMVHVPNTGRCREILLPRCKILLREENGINRKTKYDLIAAFKGDKLINIDSQIPNKVVEEALREGNILSLKNYKKIQREKTFGNSRFDFKLTDDQENIYYLEVKGVTLEEKGIAKFPDAPTERGCKHLLELIQAKNSGFGAGVLFLLQMDNIKQFMPHDTMDKNFGEALREANKAGVDIFAYECDVDINNITLTKPVEICLD
jgi:sugar fermentation stimulation protein A